MVNIQCQICRDARPFCIHKSYPIPRPKEIEQRVKEKLKKEFFGPSCSVFVGHEGYPNVNIGPTACLEEKESMEDPSSWFGKSYQEIIELRSLVIRSKQNESIFSRNKFIQENQELALASRQPDIEIVFRSQPFYRFVLSEYLQPMGPSGTLEKLQITENTKIDRKVEYIVKDDLKAKEAAVLLYNNNQDVYKITAILSSGILGRQENKKLVPTRWSITATDDIIGNGLIGKIKTYREISDYFVFESSYMDNHFKILFMPGSWEFENFECWAPGSNWSAPTQSRIIEEYEPFGGRKTYASSQAGGYYATRLGVLEYLEKTKRQAKALVFREVGEGYSMPLGVWQVRENVRNAMKSKFVKFSSGKAAFSYLKNRLKMRFESYRKKSKILGRKTIENFFWLS